ncbi:MAG: D-lyxose/D-mannose family sugar isomerase [Planctomycetota bacterium]|nr:MAG: D-lyxose/D-mannose family sugar isomerase [Planctomycetota bacterium]
MKRSQINENIRLAKKLMAAHHFILPQWAYWSLDDWQKAGPEVREIKESMLGWDITDFGLGDFAKQGLTLFTIRNGNLAKSVNEKTYAEKIMMVQVNQITPMHFHWSKMEDIINRGGGVLAIQLYNSTPDEDLDKTGDVKVSIDGIEHTVKAGDIVKLEPGDSITLTRGLYHKFWAEKANCLVGEVSMVNDDTKDNRFHEPLGRFPEIEEDEPPLHLLCNEYPVLG